MAFSKLLKLVTPSWHTLALVMLVLALESALSLAQPWLAGQLTRTVLDEAPELTIKWILLLWLALLTTRSLLDFIGQYAIGKTGETMAAQLRQRIVDQQLRLPMHEYLCRSPGDLLALLSNDAGILSNFVTQTLVQILPSLLIFLGALLMIARLDPLIAALAILALPIYVLALTRTGRIIRPLASGWINAWSALIARVEENLTLLPTIKAFSRETLESARFAELNSRLLKLSTRQLLLQSALTPAMGLLAGAALLVLLWFGARQLASGQLQRHELVSLIFYALLMTRPIAALAGVYGQVVQTRGAAERLVDFFALLPESPPENGQHLQRPQGNIEFRDVSYAYPGKSPLFEHLNLRIQAGETITLTGPNGAGKTTLAHLLLRFIEPTSGTILIDGIEIQKLDPTQLREHIALVAQHTLLQGATVAENIAWGRPGATLQEIHSAAQACGAEGFINTLPQQFATPIGHQGQQLSGGQRQSLALARVLLKHPTIYIFDEATAMLDPQVRQTFSEHRDTLTQACTVILISHQPDPLQSSGRVYRLKNGRLSRERH